MNQKNHKTSIGGQALYEGIMMRGPKKHAIALRLPDGTIETTVKENHSIRQRYRLFRLPILRGMASLVESLSLGYKTLTYSFEKAGLEEEPTKFELWLSKVFGKSVMDLVVAVAGVLGVVLALSIFMLLPAAAVKLLGGWIPAWSRALAEGVIKIAVFLIYVAAISHMEEIRRTFEYHGAEHKTIFAYEAGLELTVENVRKMSRFHPRCGTSFLIIAMIVSVLFFSLPIVTWDSVLLRMATKLIMLPLVVGVAYEFIYLAGKYDNWLTRTLSAPGLWIQRLTTKEPDDSQIEVAIASMLPVLTGNPEDDKW
ncbi:MAG: DUF1385 domain-containing protein [Clostridia bacterium]|jgi:uncharacterized protein YqhQ|nr:DUF1385 domain-containing protein [Clostridia bacterium]MBQ6059554.1 DUF1385 domain-containing protein [Clostridia bacterium]